MTGGEKEQKKGEGKGFASLSSLVSDVDTTTPPANMDPAAAPPSTGRPAAYPAQPQPQPSQQRQTYQEPAQPASSGSSGGKWALGIAVAIGILWFIGQSDESPTATSQEDSPLTQSETPIYSPSTAEPQALAPPLESIPPIGQDLVLSTTQIRYCLAEDIRLEGAKSAANNDIDSDVEGFNEMVADYNSRCGSFRYRSGALEGARRDVEPYRSQLQAEGSSRFARPSTGSLSTSGPSLAAPNAMVQAIQRKLNELGYEAGTADGLMGGGTRAAIVAFQRAQGLTETGMADQALLLQLQRAPTLKSVSQAENRPATRSVQLSSEEAASLEAVCSTDKYVNGPAAYRRCLGRQKAALAAGVRRPSLNALSSAEEESIEAACSTDKYLNGPAAYNKCINTQLTALDQQGGEPDLSRLSTADRRSIESACSTDKYLNGPAAYNRCLAQQLARLQ